jgi:hypothetical protein
MKSRIISLVSIAVCILLWQTGIANASPELDIGGELSFWWTIYEGNENGLQQAVTQDPAADEASGFNISLARLNFTYDDPERKLGGKFQLRLEEKVDILDLYLKWDPRDDFELYLGQMKVPSTYEALEENTELDFISRSTLAGLLTDWSLSRTSYYSSFYGNKSVYRDAGIGVKGAIKDDEGIDKLKYFFMIGNGLGHSLYIGGRESKEFIFTNNFGDYFYGLRADWMPSDDLTIGGHYSINKHKDVLFNDETTVFDLDRKSHSIDIRYDNPDYKLAFMYGGGVIDDDFFHTGERNLDYAGWEGKILVPLNKTVEAGLRYDNYSYTAHGSPSATDQNNWTIGLNYNLEKDMRVQVNYMLKDTNTIGEPDLDDDIFFVNFQYKFNTGDILNREKAEDTEEKVVVEETVTEKVEAATTD